MLAVRGSEYIVYLQLSEGEATASAHTAIVLDGRAAHYRPQFVDGARSELGGLLYAGIAARLLLAGLSWRICQIMCTTGATALSLLRMRGELPGRSARGHGVASPCGSLRRRQLMHFARRGWRGGWLRLCWICWLCLIVILAVLRRSRKAALVVSKARRCRLKIEIIFAGLALWARNLPANVGSEK